MEITDATGIINKLPAALLAQISDTGTRVLVMSPPNYCVKCNTTKSKFRRNGIDYVEYEFTDSSDPVLLAAKAALGVAPDSLIDTPVVLIDLEWGWNGIGESLTKAVEELIAIAA